MGISIWNEPPQVIESDVFSEMPGRFRRTAMRSAWADANRGGHAIDSFLEGPSFDRDGNLYVTDIPFGRIFRISPAGDWTLVAEYDGWPNGLKVHADGRLFVTDYKRGVVVVDPATGAVTTEIGSRNTESFKGVNDLCFADNGDLYFTDQGQTGLHDPTGRVYRRNADGRLDCLIATVPSPNGLVLNPAQNVLYIAATRANAIWRGPIMPDRSLSKVGLFFQLGGASGPDGMAIDEDGNLAFAHAGAGAVIVLSPRGAALWAVRAKRGAFITNLAYGGGDRRTLYMTESETGSILMARMPVAGRPMYSHR